MENDSWSKKWWATGIILLFFATSVAPTSAHDITEVSSPPSRGTWLYVGGDGPGNYSKIQDAVNNASDGDTVFVYDDSAPYFEHVLITKSIRLVGEDKSTTCIDAQYNGTVIEIHADNVTIANLLLQHSGRDTNAGINLYGSNCNLSDNLITENFYGIRVRFTDNNMIFGNDLQDNGNFNIYLYDTNHSTVQHNTISNPFQYTEGIVTDHCIDDTILNNTINNTYSGMLISATTNSTIEANLVTNCFFLAVYLDGAPDNTISRNVLNQRILDWQACDITLSNSPRCTIENNTLLSGILIREDLTGIVPYPNTILNNLVQGKPLVYLDQKADLSINYPCGQIILFHCRNITVQNQDIQQTVRAIYLESSDGCTLLDNTLSSNSQGIICHKSNSTTISENIIQGNYQDGLNLDTSNNDIIINNTIANTKWFGLRISGSDNTVADNIISGNDYAFSAESGQNDLIANNTVSGNNRGLSLRFLSTAELKRNHVAQNTEYGIAISESIKNTFVENVFTDNGYGLILGMSCAKITVQNNEFKNNQNGLLLDNTNDNNILKNNFIDNKQDAFFKNAFFNRWFRNYWGLPKLMKIIWGTRTVVIFEHATRTYTVFHLDRFPSPRPYDIPP
ncbi:MAG TPA: right-handed parallel beta-helix repeat-containing protein [Candidatus Thermoplasmatota archaeon]|nr:right-handed parallel beta-helix repeat-containing protein [Candidatus Thermoplasmatota archaeon]